MRADIVLGLAIIKIDLFAGIGTGRYDVTQALLMSQGVSQFFFDLSFDRIIGIF